MIREAIVHWLALAVVCFIVIEALAMWWKAMRR